MLRKFSNSILFVSFANVFWSNGLRFKNFTSFGLDIKCESNFQTDFKLVKLSNSLPLESLTNNWMFKSRFKLATANFEFNFMGQFHLMPE
ncbi:hypothetical protein BpHYR1_013771 [Brachionus plicatilis]|uniref:Uncharacterized protein n=1 Tax=Brachionus plicatilis TaxID=10195 RepID=A0A3M7RAV6_BRAPC|nr:hypothetical protein BpHYR1_013771 [Brachionus plicatilis]